VDAVLDDLAIRHPALQVIGGFASAARGPGGNRLVLDGATLAEGAVGVLLGGAPRIDAVVSQGCRPVGQPFVVTDAAGQDLRELGGRPALERIAELARTLPEEEVALLSRNLHLGLVADEHLSEFRRGDFLVRNVVGATPEDGAIVVGADMQVGQTVQFQLRDARAADEDLTELIAPRHAAAALLFTCTGRGQRLFGIDDHDAAAIQELLGPIPLAGAFCAGEVGPVGQRSYVHGFTASLALFSSR
jgi:small ligand-binding sensory domain FIST